MKRKTWTQLDTQKRAVYDEGAVGSLKMVYRSHPKTCFLTRENTIGLSEYNRFEANGYYIPDRLVLIKTSEYEGFWHSDPRFDPLWQGTNCSNSWCWS